MRKNKATKKTFEQAHICCQKSVSGALTHPRTTAQLSKNCYYNNFVAKNFCIFACILIIHMATTARGDMQMLHVRAGRQSQDTRHTRPSDCGQLAHDAWLAGQLNGCSFGRLVNCIVVGRCLLLGSSTCCQLRR